MQRPLRRRQVENVRGAGVRGPHEDEDAGAGPAAASISGSSASRPSSGLIVKASAPRPATGPRRRRLADQRLAVGRGGDRNVAALAVGDHEQPGVARRRDRALRLPARGAEALEAGELELDRDARRPGARDQLRQRPRPRRRPVAQPDSRARRLCLRPAGGSGSSPRTTWLRRSATAAPSRSANGWVSPLDLRLEARPGRELRHLAAGNRDPLAGAWVDSLTRPALGDRELAEAREVDVLALAAATSSMPSSTASTASEAFLLAADPAVPADQ